jgi:hypothetical protein
VSYFTIACSKISTTETLSSLRPKYLLVLQRDWSE